MFSQEEVSARRAPGRGPVAERTSGNDAGARLRLETRAMLLHES